MTTQVIVSEPRSVPGPVDPAATLGAALLSDHDLDLDPDWRLDAACKGQTNLFFPRRAERPEARARREKRALALCMRCPVLEPCRTFARAGHEYGFWGGESEETRHLLGYTVSTPIGLRARLAARADDAAAATAEQAG